jgi:hypothetical protein
MKGNRIHWIFTLLTVFVAACDEQEQKPEQAIVKSNSHLEWQLGYSSFAQHSGAFINKADGIEYIYFAEPLTKRVLDILTINGKLKWHIPLDALKSLNEKVEGIQILSPDSILVLSMYTNHLYCFNSKGEVWKYVDLNPLLEKLGGGDHEVFVSSFGGDFYKNDTLLFLGTSRMEFEKQPSWEAIDVVRKAFNFANSAPHFFRFVNVFSNRMQADAGLVGYTAKYLCGSDSMALGAFQYLWTKNDLIRYSEHSNQFHSVSTSSLEVMETISARSQYSSVGCEPLLVEFKNFESGAIVETRQTQGCMVQMVYDNYHNLYYLSVKHDVRNRKDLDDVRDGRGPWSLMVYNSDLELMNEILMPEQTYAPENLIVCKQGLLIGTNRREYKTYEHDKAKYELFEVVVAAASSN